jgi:hypothetical protein
MLDDDGNAVLIDFDSCEKEGGPREGGTPGYMKDARELLAQKEMDWYSLECVKTWLETGKTNITGLQR